MPPRLTHYRPQRRTGDRRLSWESLLCIFKDSCALVFSELCLIPDRIGPLENDDRVPPAIRKSKSARDTDERISDRATEPANHSKRFI